MLTIAEHLFLKILIPVFDDYSTKKNPMLIFLIFADSYIFVDL